MVVQVSYARLYNTGNYENVRFEAVSTVIDGNTVVAYAEAIIAVHHAYSQWLDDKEPKEPKTWGSGDAV